MHFPEEDEPVLKEWIVKRLVDVSDADPEVLADYVLALLSNENNDTNVQEVFDTEITPFLRDGQKTFTSEIIQAVQSRSYLPGAPPPTQSQPPVVLPPFFGAPNLDPGQQAYNPTSPAAGGHKRRFQDRNDLDAPGGRDEFQGGGRPIKQPRRGGGRRGYVDPDRPPPVQDFNYGYNPRAPSLSMNAPAFQPAAPRADMANFGAGGLDPMEAMRKIQELQHQIGMMAGFATFSQPQQGYTPLSQPQQKRRGRCRDYDNKGYCARGHNCMYEHNNEPEGISTNLPTPQRSGQIQLPSGDMQQSIESLFPAFPGPSNETEVDRENRQSNRKDSRQGAQQRRSKNGGFARAPFSQIGPMRDKTQTTVVIESIPEDHFEEKKVRDFFAQFGKIVDVTMMPYKRLALVKYDKWESAMKAYKSPKVIFNNRFVKVFWYKAELHKDQINGSGANGTEAESSASNGLLAVDGEEPSIDMEEFKRQQEEAQKAHEEKMRAKKVLAEQRAELEKKRKELQAKQEEEKQKLYAKLAQKKSKLGTGDTAMEDKSADPSKPLTQTEILRATLAKLQEEAKSMNLDPDAHLEEDATITSFTEYSPYPAYPPRGRGGYYGRGRSGYTPRGSYRGRGGSAGRGNIHAAYAAYSLDNRPKKVGLSGVDFSIPEKDEALRQHLFSLGELTADIEVTPAKTLISFSDRKAAEKFYATISDSLAGATATRDDKLELAWVANTASPLAGDATVTKIEAHGGDASVNGNANGSGTLRVGEAAATTNEGLDSEMADADGSKQGQQPPNGASQVNGADEDYDVAGENEWDIG